MKEKILVTAIIVLLLFSTGASIYLLTADEGTIKKEKTWRGQYLQVLSNPFTQEEVVEGWGEELLFGGIRPSNFKTTLANGLSATASTSETINVSSITTKDAHTLVSADIGDYIVFHINPGASNDEIVSCTGISGTSFTGCTRGLNFYSTGTTSGNAKAHSAGETVVISNDDHYLVTQYPQIDGNTIITGNWKYSDYAYYEETIGTTGFGGTASTSAFATKYYVDYVGAGGFTSLNINTSDGIQVYGTSPETMGINLASSSGLYFLSTGDLAIYASESQGIGIDDWGRAFFNASDSFAFTGTNTFSGSNTFTASTSFAEASGTAPYFYGDGSDGDATISSNASASRDMYYDNLTIATGIDYDPNGYRIFVKDTLTFQGTGKIERNGRNGSVGANSEGTGNGGIAGTGLSGGILGNSASGSYGGDAGCNNVVGRNASASSNFEISLGVTGNKGGVGGDGGQTGGTGASGGTIASASYVPRSLADSVRLLDITSSASFQYIFASTGGGGGGGGGTSNVTCAASGGGGGSGAGLIVLYAKNIITVDGNDYIQAIGGDGGNGGTGTRSGDGSGGGGAGGGGGTVILVYSSKTGSGTITVSGGTKGTAGAASGGATAGTDGQDGDAGKTYILRY